MNDIQELTIEYHALEVEIESYERAIIIHADEPKPVHTLLLSYRNVIDEYVELRCKLRELDQKGINNVET